MILRLAAALALVLGVVGLLLFLAIVGKAPWSPPELRHLRAMKDRRTAPERYLPLTVAGFAALPAGLPLAAYAPLERRAVSFDGYVQRMVTAPDGDLHFELVAAPGASGTADAAYVTAELTPQWGAGSDAWSLESLLVRLRVGRGGITARDEPPRRVRVSGWLLYDLQFDQRWPRGAAGRESRVSGWEIHPVTRIEIREAADSAWREVPR